MGIAATRVPAEAAFPEDGRRQAVRAFLMSRRARLRPSDVGLPETARRRTPGLRREEVAQLAGLSAEWYTHFEMAKAGGGFSARTVDAVARALRLNSAETRYLHGLVAETVLGDGTAAGVADPTLLEVIDGYRTGPAFVLNARMDVLAGNRFAAAVFGDLAGAAGDERNWLWFLEAHRHAIEDWELHARQAAATFRGSICEHAADATTGAFVERLLAASEVFRRTWFEHEVGAFDDAPPLAIAHPELGRLRFKLRVLSQSAPPTTHCWFLIPDDATTASAAYTRLRRDLER